MKNVILLLFSIILFSCSSDDDSNSEFIVGKWVATKIFESGVEVDLNVCNQNTVFEFYSDSTLRNYLINEDQIPQNVLCGLLPSDYYEWKIMDDNKYGINHVNFPENINITFTRNGNYLDMVYTSSENMVRLKRY